MQKAIAESTDELLQLKRTVTALRDQMEILKGDYEGKMQESERSARDEVKQLRDTVVALRAELEARGGQ